MFDVSKLVCYGCAHSSASDDYPSRPSGERPCCFCVRNKDREQWRKTFEKSYENENEFKAHIALAVHGSPYDGVWYDGSKSVKSPMDCYQTLDMKDQVDVWLKKRCKHEKSKNAKNKARLGDQSKNASCSKQEKI